MFVVDTNVLIYAANTSCPEHARCRERLTQWRLQALPWFLTWGVIYEFMRVTTHPRVFAQPLTPSESLSFIRAVTAAPALRILTESEDHQRFVERLVEDVPQLSGNIWHDAHLVALMQEHGITRVYTRDTGFHRFSGIDVLDPLAES